MLSIVHVRPLAPGEDGPILEVFAGMSARSRFLRYHAPTPRLTRQMLRRLSAVDGRDHVALVASVDGRAVGLARWIRDPVDTSTAELAIEVADAYQSSGIGTSLTIEAAISAVARGVSTFVCAVHPENSRLRATLRAPEIPIPVELRVVA